MAVIGRNAAVADLGWLRLAGFPAWLLWIFIHLLYLAQFQNRLLVLAQWSWNYITRNRSALLIPERNAAFSPAEVLVVCQHRLTSAEENELRSSPVKEKVES